MDLPELCEPLFTRVCLLNRMGRKGGGNASYDALRADVEALFKRLGETANADPLLRTQWERLEVPLVFFVDSMIAESGLRAAAAWHQHRLAYDRKELAGDEKFFDLLDETLADPAPEAVERLRVLRTCLGLGFTGWYAGQTDYLRGKMAEIDARLGKSPAQTGPERICPEAYEHVDTRELMQPRVSHLGGLAVVFAGLCLIVITVEVYLFRAASLSVTDTAAAVSTLDPRTARAAPTGR